MQRVNRVDDLLVRQSRHGLLLYLVYPLLAFLGQAAALEHVADSGKPDAFDRPQLNEPRQVIDVDRCDCTWRALGCRAIAIRLDLLGECALLSRCVVKRRRHDNGVLALCVVTMSSDRGYTEHLRLDLGSRVLLALRFQSYRVPARLVAGAGAEVRFGHAVGLALAPNPRGVETETTEGLYHLDFQQVFVVSSVSKSICDRQRGTPPRLLSDVS